MAAIEKISIAIPTHADRQAWYGETINQLHDHEEVSEIVIVDDCTGLDIFAKITNLARVYKKVNLSRNAVIEGAFRNKYIAVSQCREAYVAIMDSDNIFKREYLAAFLESKMRFTINCPVKANPYFNYTSLQNIVVTKSNVAVLTENPTFQMMINTGNYIVDRDFYLSALQKPFSAGEKAPQCSDVAWAAYHILNAGGTIGFVPGMQYDHLDHPDSTYRKFKDKEPGATLRCLSLLKELS
jgi:glycosyltransferase involved in cell wall biosynthesis